MCHITFLSYFCFYNTLAKLYRKKLGHHIYIYIYIYIHIIIIIVASNDRRLFSPQSYRNDSTCFDTVRMFRTEDMSKERMNMRETGLIMKYGISIGLCSGAIGFK